MLNLVLALIGIFALIVVVGRLLHRYFIYLPDRTRVAPNEAGLLGVEEIVFKAADGTKLIAWYQPARGSKPTLLYFTGNSGNVANRAGKIRTIAADGYGVFMLNYRRYGGSQGRPNESRITADAVSAYDYLRGLGVAPHDIVAYGESLGTAVATRLALQRHIEALVLEAPFTSIVDVGRLMWKGFPLSLIMADQYRTIDRIGAGQGAALHRPWRAAMPSSRSDRRATCSMPRPSRRAWSWCRKPATTICSTGAPGTKCAASWRACGRCRWCHGRAADGDRRGGKQRGSVALPTNAKSSFPALCRASRFSIHGMQKTWMAGTSPAMTEVELDLDVRFSGAVRASACRGAAPGLAAAAFALRLLAGELAGAADGLGLLAGALLGRLLVIITELHLAEDAFALHFLLQRPRA